jgi:hypothetical protein
MWLQRKYITRKHANYDPTSTRDEDLPLDLDHAIPRSFFDGDARTREHDIGQHVSDEVKKAFKEDRYTVGDSLGNLRWFSASDNRARQANEIEPEGQENDPDKIPVQDAIDRKNWNDLISKLNTATERWTIESIVNFQRLIDLRTLAIVKKINSESGIDDLLGIATASDK